jgi:hypothetical protein
MSTWEKFKDKLSNPIFHYGVGKRVFYLYTQILFNGFLFFKAICSFTGSSPDQLSLLLGDSIHVREECEGK